MNNNTWAVTTPLLPHQQAAVAKMKPSLVGALFMDMGTGKSLTTIELASLRRHKISKIIWCCTVSLKRNTRDQILTHTDCSADDVYLFDSKTTDANLPSASWYVVGLESIGGSSRVVMALNALVDERTMLIVDESSFIKGHRAKRTRRLQYIGERARYRLVLNGTPISQGIEDLYAQMTFLSQRILGYKSWYSFRRSHLQYSDRFKGMIDRRLHTDWIGAKIAPYVYQVTKAECLSLPDKTYSSHWVPLTQEQDELYDQVKQRYYDDILSCEDDGGVAVYRMFGALQAVVNGVVPAGFLGAGGRIDNNKTVELLQLLHGLPDSHVVIWVRYRANVDEVTKRIRSELSQPVFSYYGDLSERARDEALHQWRQQGGYLVATQGCGGFGLTLTEAAYSIFYGNGFKYAERLQAEDRLHRIGQEHNVHYVSLFADSGIEERIASALARKGDALAEFREEVAAVKRMGTDRLHELLKSI